MEARRSPAVRLAAALAAACLAFGIPVLLVLLTVVDERWRPLLGTLLVGLIAVSVAGWFLTRPRHHPDTQAEELPDGP